MLLILLVACSLVSDAELDARLDRDRDGYPRPVDCDDGDPAVHPGAPELCNDRDDDCDGEIDGATAEGAVHWYRDLDADGAGDPRRFVIACAAPPGFVARPDDCEDASPLRGPGQAEVCDFVDNDCDGRVDLGAVDATTWYLDADADGFGDPETAEEACEAPSPSYVTDDRDCDDTVASAYPGSSALETPGDGIDTDCDGVDACTDLDCDGVPDVLWVDPDGHVIRTQAGGRTEGGESRLPVGPADAIRIVDVDEDGVQDLLTWGATGAWVWTSAPGDPAGADSLQLTADIVVDVQATDLDGDGFGDLLVVVAAQADGDPRADTRVVWGTEAGFDVDGATPLPGTGTAAAALADLDRDGRTDVLLCDALDRDPVTREVVEPGGVTVFWASSVGRPSASRRTRIPLEACTDLATGDVDGDELVDVLVATPDDPEGRARLVWNDGQRFRDPEVLDLPALAAVRAELLDLDGDGLLDALLTDDPDLDGGVVAVAWGDPAEGLGAPTPVAPATPDAQFTTLAGAPVLVLPGEVASALRPGAADRFPDADAVGLATGGLAAAAGDVDGDGDVDLVLSGPDGVWVHWAEPGGLPGTERTRLGVAAGAARPAVVGGP